MPAIFAFRRLSGEHAYLRNGGASTTLKCGYGRGFSVIEVLDAVDRVTNLRIERVTLPNGTVVDLELMHHPGASAIAAVDEQERVFLIRQYRYAVNAFLWELPAGSVVMCHPGFVDAARIACVQGAGRVERQQHLDFAGLLIQHFFAHRHHGQPRSMPAAFSSSANFLRA